MNQPGHKPSAAPEPGQQEGDYNTITHNRQQMSSAGKGRDETADPYNIPESFGAAKPGAHGTVSYQSLLRSCQITHSRFEKS